MSFIIKKLSSLYAITWMVSAFSMGLFVILVPVISFIQLFF